MTTTPASTPFQLRPAQAEAAYTLDRHVSVTAGPGAGKTRVLVERYLHVLRTEDVSVDQIVAITFTNRAANEMRERIRAEIDRLLRSESAGRRDRWLRHKRTLESAVITTIHGFCARLLREFPLEAGIDPQFVLLDEHQTALIEEAMAEEALTALINSGHEQITRLTLGVGRPQLVAGLLEIYRSIRNQGLDLRDVIFRTGGNHSTAEDYSSAIELLSARIDELLKTRGLTPSALERQGEVASRWPVLRQALINVSTQPSLAEYCQLIEDFRQLRPHKRGVLTELIASLDELIWEDKLKGRVPRICFDLHAREYALEALEVIGRIEKRLSEEKRKLAALDFDDLQLQALRLLEAHPSVRSRIARRYRFFLVDEFQDTNGLQRDLLMQLALVAGRRANLFIVGDRKQSIYGFRGADVDVFRKMAEALVEAGGASKPLHLNFRSQQPLVNFFNFLFPRIFASTAEGEDSGELGYVEYEAGEPVREPEDQPPLIELMVDVEARAPGASPMTELAKLAARERDAWQVAERILALVEGRDPFTREAGSSQAKPPRSFEYRDIAMLFRAMTSVGTYESALRRAGIPYRTVQGKGFYQREEVTDLIQLLRFLDNTTDELALAAVLRSPLCGISDNALLALRCAPPTAGRSEAGRLRRRRGSRNLLPALAHHEGIDFIDQAERATLDRAAALLNRLIERRHNLGIAELLRQALDRSEYRTVIAANYDGAQRLANVDKLVSLAGRFERAGSNMVRDFVRFVEDFEKIGGRESEGQLDESINAVKLMTIHQSKGLEFTVVIIADLARSQEVRGRDWFALDRHLGLSVKVPDGRGKRLPGTTFDRLSGRAALREKFESARLLYVGATRARDRLILSAAVDRTGPGLRRDSWLELIVAGLGVDEDFETGVVEPEPGVLIRLARNHFGNRPGIGLGTTVSPPTAAVVDTSALPEEFPLLEPVGPERGSAVHRFTVTQLVNYRRCPRQYYFDRVIHAPGGEQIAVWNQAEAPEPPANLTATIRGAVIHRFCERYTTGDDPLRCLDSSIADVLSARAAELGDRLYEIDRHAAVADLMPLAQKYISSQVRLRIEASGPVVADHLSHGGPTGEPGVFSELRFRLRRPVGILTGTIDKLLVARGPNSGLSIEIIDFKTDRFQPRRSRARRDRNQLSLGFLESTEDLNLRIRSEIEQAAADYELQMQAYALAVRELLPGVERVRVTLHFLHPDLEVSLAEGLLDTDVCRKAIDTAMMEVISSPAPESFPVRPADHCRFCSFLELCQAGRNWLQKS